MVEYMTVREVANRLRVSPITVRRYIKSGRLSAVRVGHAVRVPADSFEKLAVPIEPSSRGGGPPDELGDAKPFTPEDFEELMAFIEREPLGAGDGITDVSSNIKKYLAEVKFA